MANQAMDIEIGEATKPTDMTSGRSLLNNKSLRFDSGIKEATVVWKGLNKFVGGENGMPKRQILFNINGVAKPGDLIALMGPSGSGKTTLLNVLGGRALANLTGGVFINNALYRKSMKRMISYVLQQDIFYNNLTVREQLFFTSQLRLPDSVTMEEKAAAVNQVIELLRIQKCADTQILLVSGGEKKRCNIGTELLTNPSVLLLDEPTSGLDSTAANSLIVTLRALALDKMTVITSIHQPSSKVFYSFDKLILLADGHPVYYGPPSAILAHLASVGYVPPADYNPADFLMDLITSEDVDPQAEDEATPSPSNGGVDEEQKGGEEKAKQGIRAKLIAAWDDSPVIEEVSRLLGAAGDQLEGHNLAAEEEGDHDIDRYLAGYSTQFRVLLQRALINSRSSVLSNLNTIQAVAIALITGFVWWRMPNTEDRINDRAGYVFFFMTYWFFMSLFQGMMQFLPEREIILKERAAGTYQLSAYFLSKITAELPVRLWLPCLFLAISYPMANLNPSPRVFFATVGTQLLASICGESVGIFIGTITLDFEKALVYATLTSLTLMLTGGFFAQNLPVFVQWIRYLSPFKYSYDACLRLVFSSSVPCDSGDVIVECASGASSASGAQVVDYLGATQTVGFNNGMLILFLVFFRVAAYLALRFMPHNSGRK